MQEQYDGLKLLNSPVNQQNWSKFAALRRCLRSAARHQRRERLRVHVKPLQVGAANKPLLHTTAGRGKDAFCAQRTLLVLRVRPPSRPAMYSVKGADNWLWKVRCE